MGVQNASILEGATVSFTGGTSKTYTPDGLRVNNGVHLIDASVTDARTRPQITVRSVPGTVQKDGTWTEDTLELTVARPKVLADGTQKFPSIRIKGTFHAELTQAERDALRLMACEALMDTDFDSYWRTGSLA